MLICLKIIDVTCIEVLMFLKRNQREKDTKGTFKLLCNPSQASRHIVERINPDANENDIVLLATQYNTGDAFTYI